MKKLQFFMFLLFTQLVLSQDGSDIQYVDVNDIDNSMVGKYLQIDFYYDSFGSNKFENSKHNQKVSSDFIKALPKADTIELKFQNKTLFKEVRNDDGFNNWFSQQYLESIDGNDSIKVRIQKMKLLSVSDDSIEVKLFGHHYKNNKEIFSKYLTNTIKISKKSIFQVLLNKRQPIRKGLSIYRAYQNYPDFTKKPEPKCYYCFQANENNIYDHPLLSDYHIERFDYENQQIILNEYGKSIIINLEIPLQGLPVILTLDGEILYEFWFWTVPSSFGCDRVYAYPELDFKIKFGLPKNFAYGTDPRFNYKLKKYSELK